tara:strand:- start:648 stop:833 length:186 start_codon:yes stop_codon:yes gene_type:complete
MPLRRGSSKSAIKHNIKKFLGDGKSHKQAVAAALTAARGKPMSKKKAREAAIANLNNSKKA